jgi:uncharacterized membrane-anchored protein
MSVIELKQKMHSQIDFLFEQSDIEDLAANMEYFFQNRQIYFDSNSPIFIKNLNASLEQNVEMGIDSLELKQKVKQWLTK